MMQTMQYNIRKYQHKRESNLYAVMNLKMSLVPALDLIWTRSCDSVLLINTKLLILNAPRPAHCSQVNECQVLFVEVE